MNGNITTICINEMGHRTYGFILGEDGVNYFFHKNDLTNSSITQIQEGDSVEFVPESSSRYQGRHPGRFCVSEFRQG